MSTPKLESQIVVRGQIADASGHTEFTGTIDEAMATIMDQVTKAGKWVYVNGNPFMFTNKHTLAEQAELRNMLATAEEPTFMLTAKLQGGAASVAKIRTKVTKRPLSSVLNTRTRAHLAVSMGTSKGQPVIDLLVSDFGGSKGRLQRNREQILAAVFDALNKK